MVSDPNGGVREEYQRGSQINEVNSNSGTVYRSGKPGISSVRNSSKVNSYDDYGQRSEQEDSSYRPYNANDSDWRVQR